MSSRRLWVLLALLPASFFLRPSPSTAGRRSDVAPEVPGGVEVTPDAGGPLYPEANTSGHQADFFVKNTRTITTTYTLTCGGTGSVSGCTPDQSSVTLSPQQTTDVSATYTTGSAGSAIVVLRATGAAADTGYFNLTIVGPGAPGVALKNQNDNNKDRSACLVAGAGEAAWQCGDLLVSHSMPGYTTMGRERSLTLVYSSAQAVPKPLVAANITNGDISLPQSVYAELRVTTATSGSSQVIMASGTYSGWNLSPAPRQIALTFDASDTTLFPTGAYPFTLEVKNLYPTSYSTVRTGTLLIVNRSASEFGAGWSLAGVERLYTGQPHGTSNGDVLWVGGEGSAKLYRKLDAAHWEAPGGAGRDTIVDNGNGTYTRTLRHKIQVVYNSAGRHITTINRFEQPTNFYWSVAGRLDSIVIPPAITVSRKYRFAWDGNGKVDSLYDPAGRALNITVTSGRTLTIRDPDLVNTTFLYDAAGRMLKRTNRLNYTTRFEYANNLRITKVFAPQKQSSFVSIDTAITEFKPWDEKGLPGQAAALDTSVYTTVLGPRPSIPDDARFWIDQWGSPTKIVDAIGNTTLIVKGDTANPALATKVTYPNGRLALMAYNRRGNLTTMIDSTKQLVDSVELETAVTVLEYTDTLYAPDSPTKVTDPMGRSTYFYYNQQFGTTDHVVDPRNHTARFTYQGSGIYQGLVLSISEEAVHTWHEQSAQEVTENQISTFGYDSVGNLQTLTSPTGVVTSVKMDPIGRVSETYSPYGQRMGYRYDSMNRVVRTVQYTGVFSHPTVANPLLGCDATQILCADPAVIDTIADSLPITYSYDALTMTQVTDPRGVYRAYTSDPQGTPLSELGEPYNVSKYAFSGFGITDSVKTPAGAFIRFGHDTLARLRAITFPDLQGQADKDSIVYTYDNMGNRLTAKGTDIGGTITRTYYADGTLRKRMTTGYTILYLYNAARQRTHMILNGVDTVRYTYDSAGDLDSLIAILDTIDVGARKNDTLVFRYDWDELGRRRQINYPFTIYVTYRYDAAGNLRYLESESVQSNAVDRLDFNYHIRSVDAVGRAQRPWVDCEENNGSSTLMIPCTAATDSNVYNRVNALLRQNSSGNRDTLAFDASGNVRYLYASRNLVHPRRGMRMAALGNQLVADSTPGSATDKILHSYNANGARSLERPADSVQATVEDWHWYNYDGLGRPSSIDSAGWQPQGKVYRASSTKRCLYNADGAVGLPCGNSSMWFDYDGDNVVTNGIIPAVGGRWTFIHGPAIDEPLVSVRRTNGIWDRVLFTVTDGNGRQIAVGDRDGSLLPSDFDNGISGAIWWRFSGAANKATTFGAERQQNSEAPRYAFFRNRLYDSRTARWTQEDPIGLAGGMNLYQFNGNNPVAFTDPFGLCPDKLRDNEPACDKWNRLQSAKAQEIIAGEATAGNVHALPVTMTIIPVNADRVQPACKGLRATIITSEGCNNGTLMIVNADAGTPALAALIVHEEQHPLGARMFGVDSRAALEACAQKRQTLFIWGMHNEAQKRAALSYDYLAKTINPNAPGCGFN